MLNVYEKQIKEYMSNNQIAVDFTKPTKSRNLVTFRLNSDSEDTGDILLGFDAKGKLFVIGRGEGAKGTPIFLDNPSSIPYFLEFTSDVANNIDNFLPTSVNEKFEVGVSSRKDFEKLSADEKNAIVWTYSKAIEFILNMFSEYFKFNKNSGFWHDLNKATKGKSKDFLGSFFEKIPSDEDFEKYSRAIGNKLSKQVISVRDSPELDMALKTMQQVLSSTYGVKFNTVYGKDSDSKSNMPLIVGGAVVGGALLFLLMRKK